MPELPDVEIFKQYLDATALHQKIETVDVRDEIILDEITTRKLKDGLQDRAFESTHRHGKYLFAEINESEWLALHFGMTGRLKYFKAPDREPEYSQLVIGFANDYHLAYVAPRKLGEIELAETIEKFLEKNELGPDALSPDFTPANFQEIIENTSAMVKSALMDQTKMAGIGNVYSDEILFQAGLHPKRKANQLDQPRVEKLFETMKNVLQAAIEHQANPDQFPAGWLTPHRDEEAACPRCEGRIERIKISGRSGYWCPNCQT